MKQFISGQYISQGFYKSFQPEFINRQLQFDNMEVLQLLSQADRELGPDFFLISSLYSCSAISIIMFNPTIFIWAISSSFSSSLFRFSSFLLSVLSFAFIRGKDTMISSLYFFCQMTYSVLKWLGNLNRSRSSRILIFPDSISWTSSVENWSHTSNNQFVLL